MKKLVTLVLILTALSGLAAAQPEINVSQSSDVYDTVEAEPLGINVSTNITDVEDITLYSNETGQVEPHQVYTQSIDSYQNSTEARFEWTNDNQLLEEENIEYFIEINDGNYTSDTYNFNYIIYPVIQEISYEEEINSRQIMEIDAEILHPIGAGRLQITEIEIETPNNQKTVVDMRQTEAITQNHLSGYLYRGSFGQTTQEGEYTATIKASDEYREVTEEITFEVQTDGVMPGAGTRLNPAYIGQASIIGSINLSTFEQNIYAQIAGGLLFLSTLVLIAAVIGGAGTEENDFTDHQEFAY